MRHLFLFGLLLAGCTPYSETVGGAAPVGTVWVLDQFNDQSFAGRATIRFESSGKLVGNAPCNSFSARQTAPLPWFEVEDLSVTKRSCPQIAAETAFLDALQAMDFSEIGGERMLLSNAAGQTLLFRTETAQAGA